MISTKNKIFEYKNYSLVRQTYVLNWRKLFAERTGNEEISKTISVLGIPKKINFKKLETVKIFDLYWILDLKELYH